MIKKLQLRGISRTPSDRMTEDGGCMESLNMQLEAAELAPMQTPTDISAQVRGGYSGVHVQYIHKLPSGEEIFICFGPENYDWIVCAFRRGSTTGTAVSIDGVVKINVTETQTFAAVDNMLIIYDSGGPYYLLWNGTGYKYLGSNIPRPTIEIISEMEESVIYPHAPFAIAVPNAIINEDYGNNTKEAWDAALHDGNYEKLVENVNRVWSYTEKKMDEQRHYGNFMAPMFIRYAVRLYDGSYIYASDPILCGAEGGNDWIYIYFRDGYLSFHIRFDNLYKVRIKGSYDAGDWRDLVQSVDFFMSEPIYTPAVNSSFSHMEEVQVDSEASLHMTFEGMDENSVLNSILGKSQFYLIKSVSLGDGEAFNLMKSGKWILYNTDDYKGENLFTKKTMPGTYRDSSQYLPVNGASEYNGRLLFAGATELLPRGSMFLNGQCSTLTDVSAIGYRFRYKIVDSNGSVSYVLSQDRNGSVTNKIKAGHFAKALSENMARQYFSDETHTSATTVKYSRPYSWICYPDTRCESVEVYAYNGSTYLGGKIIPMSAHPGMECSFAFFGLGVSLLDILTTTAGNAYTSISSSDAATNLANENRTLSSPNKIFLSETSNPFVFPAGGIITFNDEVIGTAMTSAPLSEGQFGQFPLYVFTGDGIRTLGINSEGTISSKVAQPNLARHVALKGTILGLEQAVVFTTKRGVMMLTGGTVRCISETMNGRHETFSTALALHIGGWAGWTGTIPNCVNSSRTFMQFMESSRVAYDHNAERLIFMDNGTNGAYYHYVYMLRTGTWHKMQAAQSYLVPLNGFPECLLAAGSTVYDYSTVLDSSDLYATSASARYGIIATRPFDLGEPDVRKVIRNVRMRGQFKRKDVQYVLMGSMDGINWKIITSLNDGSYKLFRMVILAHLQPTERISWIDIDYQSRYTNRLR